MKRFLLILILIAQPLWAVQPDEVLDDPALESRARDISAGLRCPVCRNESIDESSAEISRELRLLVRERLLAGDSNREVVDYIVARYGEYVLLKPTTDGANVVLWAAAPVMLLIALGVGWAAIRRKPTAAQTSDLSEQEKQRLEEILNS